MVTSSIPTPSLTTNQSSGPPFLPDQSNDKSTSAEARSTVPVVLLVEDNSSDVYVIDLVLKDCGIPMTLQVASDGEQALAVLKRSEEDIEQSPLPALILLDWNLPRISGAEVLAHLCKSERWRKVPVVVVTSTNSPLEVEEMKKLGAACHFRKPTNLAAFGDLKGIVLDLLAKPKTGSSQ
jgi:two-component system, chemotaxis family, response regulator Rcp1